MFTATVSYITWSVNPDIFVIPGLNHPVRWYGLCWAVGLILSQMMMNFIYKKEGRSEGEVDTMTLYIVAGTLLGARLGHVLFYDPVHYLQNPLMILAVWEGGLASHGGAIGILISSYLFARKTKVSYLWLLDRLSIVAALTGSFIRVGNLMNSEIVGIPTTLPWGFIFTSIDDVPRHPAQLYEAIYCLFLFVGLFTVWYQYRARIKTGTLVGWFIVILFSLRFVDEFLKIDQVEFEAGMVLNMGQLLSIPFILTGIIILIRSSKEARSYQKPS
ncbi:MAG: prolipoprotein diacylglyceryl transferase [Cyclobacteriaceae bacterium]|nr:prolipoprotein diacylglyceryl transferase [Cyclobacteriaceae bacterium]